MTQRVGKRKSETEQRDESEKVGKKLMGIIEVGQVSEGCYGNMTG